MRTERPVINPELDQRKLRGAEKKEGGEGGGPGDFPVCKIFIGRWHFARLISRRSKRGDLMSREKKMQLLNVPASHPTIDRSNAWIVLNKKSGRGVDFKACCSKDDFRCRSIFPILTFPAVICIQMYYNGDHFITCCSMLLFLCIVLYFCTFKKKKNLKRNCAEKKRERSPMIGNANKC